MKIVFVNRFFHPDHSATSQVLSQLAFELAERGYNIEIIASQLLYDDSTARLPKSELLGNVRVHRVATTRFGRAWLPGRLLDYLSFYLSASWAMLRVVKKADILVAKTDPPLISLPAALVCATKGASLVNWLQDIFPEVAQALGMKGMPPFLYRALGRLRNASLNRAKANVVIGDNMRCGLLKQGLQTQAIHVIHNMAIDAVTSPIPASQAMLRREWGLENHFVVGYSGNLGRAHDHQTMLAAMRLLHARSDIHFVFIGGGANMGKLRLAVEQEQLQNVSFKPYQPIELLSQSLAVADVHLVSLRPELEGLIVPSKFYGILSAGRASTFIGAQSGELARLIKDFECGVTVEQGDPAALATSIEAMADTPDKAKAWGENARRAYEHHFTNKAIVDSWEATLKALIPDSGA